MGTTTLVDSPTVPPGDLGADPLAVATPEPPRARRGLARNALVYGAGIVARRIASFIMLPVYTHYLTPSDYGVLELLQLTVDIAVILVSAGTTAGLLRFYFKAQDERERNATIVSAFALLTALNFVATIALLLAAGPIADGALRGAASPMLVRIVAIDLLLQGAVTVPMTLMQARGRAMLHSVTSLVTLVGQLGLNILLVVVLKKGVAGVLVSTLITHLVSGLFLVTWMVRQTGWHISRQAMRDLRRFAIPYQVTTAGTFILTFGDRFVIQAVRSAGEVGLYSLAYKFGFLLATLAAAPFMTAWTPERFAATQLPRDQRDRMYNSGFRYLNMVVLSTAVGIALFVNPLLTVMSDPAFHAAAKLVPIIVFAYVFQAWSDVVQFGIDASEKTRYVTYATWGAAVPLIAGYLVLIPMYGGYGAALATLIGFVVRFLLMLVFAQRVWPVAYEWRAIVALLAWACTATVAYHLIAPVTLVAQFALATTIGAFYLVAGAKVALRDEERRHIRQSVFAMARRIRVIVSA